MLFVIINYIHQHLTNFTSKHQQIEIANQ
ncbi:hypothetical protein LYNGBM3L_35540 [Moorena producens 3L]|uniref:Uncharacterized protein n=1 Tax=Moorena producens 3L TaxID=489825 RepID=F4XUS6_9CYAN|nr:hypothetical protein LYNGBM3L_35540 [Moorena producens 3L]